MKVKIKKALHDAKMPTYATDGSGCFDLYAAGISYKSTVAKNGLVIDTGLQFEIPEGYVMLVFSRSGQAFKHGVRLSNCVGVIDSDFRGNVKVKLHLDASFMPFLNVENGDRVAQAMIVPAPKVEFEFSDVLSDTNRGAGGFGSTGVA